MAYRNKTYVCFDADNDIRMYNLMKAWKENGHVAFNFHDAHDLNNIRKQSSEETIKRRLRERLANTKVLVVLIGAYTRNLYKYVRWEIDYAVEKDIPVIGVNLNKINGLDSSRCPPVLRDELAVHVPFGQKSVDYALNNWPDRHRQHRLKGEGGAWRYNDLD